MSSKVATWIGTQRNSSVVEDYCDIGKLTNLSVS